MGLFGQNYENAGAGIAKDAPKKKGFLRFMEIFGRKFWKLFGLNLLYFLFYLPLLVAVVLLLLSLEGTLYGGTPIKLLIGALLILFAVTVGPATAGHTKILRNYVLEKPAFMVHDFLKTFRQEFKPACLVGLFDVLIVCCVGAAMYVYPQLIDSTGNYVFYGLFAITLSVGLLVLMMNFYMFLLIISTTLSLKHVFKNSLSLAIVALKKNAITLLVVAAFVAIYVLLYFFAPMNITLLVLMLLPFLPASWVGLVICFNSYPIIQKYIINPYYEQRGEINPELLDGMGEALFEDMGGKEAPIVSKKGVKGAGGSKAASHKGKIIS